MPIHPTAIIDPKSELDSSVEVGPFCVIDGHVQVAAGCRLYQGVYLSGWTQIAEECELHPGVIVGHAPQDIKYSGQRSYCRIGRGTILREYTTVHRGTDPESQTVVGENCFVLSASHVAHNCQVGDNVTLIQNAILGGHARIGDRTTVGGAAGVHQFVRVGEGAMIAGTARVCQDVLPFALVDPAGRISGINRIGLRRANTPREHFLDIREAYRVLFGMGLPFREAVARLPDAVKTPAGKKILEFVQADSARGIAGRSRSRVKTCEDVAAED
ncbi:MAG: acyl-ACP--UDP-N-acetylglucosamine O-acyltransferase [Phycisphaerales bacterium]|nr:MAG: acyl-ACP--UDP-N-acetylglucosamine O-acyltransferase [Phycisphaerales bacterium]